MATIESSGLGVKMKDRYIGCMVGALIGDCLGDPFENEYSPHPVSLKEIEKFFSGFKDEIRRGTKRHYTDDTEMTKCLADSLIALNGYDEKDIAKRYCNEYFRPKNYDPNYGIHVREVFHTWMSDPNLDVLEPARRQFKGGGSYGNGSSMRVSPIALFYRGDVKKIIDMAGRSSLLTHTHANGVNGAILQCLAVNRALELKQELPVDIDEFVNQLLDHMTTVEESVPYKIYCRKLQIMKKLLAQDHVDDQTVINELGHGIAAHESVPIAIFAFLRGISRQLPGIEVENKFEKIIRYTLSLGGDTDTIGSMTGAIAGAFLGASAIPEELQKVCVGVEHALERGKMLYSLNSANCSSG